MASIEIDVPAEGSAAASRDAAAYVEVGASTILIPIRDTDEAVAIEATKLPESADMLLDVLTAELAPLDIWIRFAIEYFRQEKMEEFVTILSEGTQEDIDEVYAADPEGRIRIHNFAAMYHVLCAHRAHGDRAVRDRHFLEATRCFNRADRVDASSLLTWIGKGVLQFYKDDLDRALNQFNMVLRRDSSSILATLGKACVFFRREKFGEALRLFRTVLRMYPGACSSVRVGIGVCLARLKKPDRAMSALRRAVELEPDNVNALAALAVVMLNEDKSEDSVREALRLLKTAYSIDPEHPTVVNHLAEHFFFRGDYARAQMLASTACRAGNHRKVQAEAFLHLARCAHAQDDFTAAEKHYAQAVKLDRSLAPAHYGLAQCRLRAGNLALAIRSLDACNELVPDRAETLKLLGILCARSGNFDDRRRAAKLLERATELHPGDADVWIAYAQLQRRDDPEAALVSLQHAMRCLERTGAEVPRALLNSIGQMLQVTGQSEEALTIFDRALKGDGDPLEDERLTILYNRALSLEGLARSDEAEAEYARILERHPQYADARMRRAIVLHDRGDAAAARELLLAGLREDKRNIDMLALLGTLHAERRELGSAVQRFEDVLKMDDADTHALLALGNVYYDAAAREARSTEQRAKNLHRASRMYKRALSLDDSNMYAAHAIACVMATQGRYAEAKDVFTRVWEASAASFVGVREVWVNLAHVHLLQGQYSSAVHLYERCLQRFYGGRDVTLLQYVANGHYMAGEYDDALRWLQRARRIDPSDLDVAFNIATVLQEHARAAVRDPRRRTLADAQRACAWLETAHREFSLLSQSPEAPDGASGGGGSARRSKSAMRRRLFDVSRAARRGEQCATLLETARAHAERMREVEAAEAERREKARARLEEAARKREEERAAAERMAAEENAERERRAAAVAERAAALAAQLADRDREREERKQRRGATSGKLEIVPDDGEGVDDSAMRQTTIEEMPGVKRGRRSQKKAKSAKKATKKSAARQKKGASQESSSDDDDVAGGRSDSEPEAASSDDLFASDSDDAKGEGRKDGESSKGDGDGDARGEGASAGDGAEGDAAAEGRPRARVRLTRKRRRDSDSGSDGENAADEGSDGGELPSAATETATPQAKRSRRVVMDDSDEEGEGEKSPGAEEPSADAAEGE